MAVSLLNAKKGVFFSLVALLLLSILIYALAMKGSYTMQEEAEVIETRVSTMDNFLYDVNKDIERGIYIASFRALLGIEDDIVNHGTYITNLPATFREILINGSLNGAPLAIMANSSLNVWTQKISAHAALIGVSLVFNITNVSIYQESPWYVTTDTTIQINMTDYASTARWDVVRRIIAHVSIIGFEDPFYTVQSLGRVINSINATPYEGHYVQGQNTTNLSLHCQGGFYTNSSGPSFLMRLAGNFSDSPYGIESLVHIPTLQAQDLVTYSNSIVDYIYFSNRSVGTLNRINNTPSWFLLDTPHLVQYQANGTVI